MVKRTNPFKRCDIVSIDKKNEGLSPSTFDVSVVDDPQPFPYNARIIDIVTGESFHVLRSRLTLLNRELTVEELLTAHPDFLAIYAEKTE